jgi:uncharacterized protein YoxC
MDIIAEGFQSFPAPLDYPLPKAVDLVDGETAVTCAPGPGFPFHLGITAVSCKSTDLSNNEGTANFTVNVAQTLPALNKTVNDILLIIRDINGTITTIKAGVDMLTTNLNTLNATVNTLSTNVSTIDTKLSTLTNTVGTVNTTVNTLNNNLNSLTNTVGTIAQKVGQCLSPDAAIFAEMPGLGCNRMDDDCNLGVSGNVQPC